MQRPSPVIGPSTGFQTREESAGKKGRARTDYVHLELSWAFKHRIRVIPVLVRGTQMPSARALPEELKRLVNRNAVELRHTHWKSDLQYLVTVLQRLLGPAKIEPPEETPVEDEAPVEIEAEDDPEIEPAPDFEPLPEPALPESSQRSGSGVWVWLLGVILVVLYFYFTASKPADKPPQAAPVKRIELKPRQ